MPSFRQTIKLGDGITVEFQDLSNRYFGDFNRVFIEVEVKIEKRLIEHHKSLLAMIAPDTIDIVYKTSLEQMAVPTAEVSVIRASLIEAFIENTRQYILKPTFIENLIKKKKYNF